nr:MAG TPA: hypothetical protein [Caudoviricetes sp.]DAK59511.1 MAG TPA: hypothetical protein [Caudoviricetes sp.]DAV82222.1 MAG TPA: hypothetical protein [Caudoviricetes sp.]DAZ40490.1 MAG TPA: hypothetical protein [Caudoviricetes sp.]
MDYLHINEKELIIMLDNPTLESRYLPALF